MEPNWLFPASMSPIDFGRQMQQIIWAGTYSLPMGADKKSFDLGKELMDSEWNSLAFERISNLQFF